MSQKPQCEIIPVLDIFSVSGEGINKGYLPVLVPVGVIGNVLSFLVGKTLSYQGLNQHEWDLTSSVDSKFVLFG